MMNVIIYEDLTDTDYINKYTVGYEELKQRVVEYSPEKVAKITDVPADDIRELARAYAQTSPAVIRIGVAIERHAGGGQAVRAIASLPALIGSWRHPGGGLLQLPLWSFPINWGNPNAARFYWQRGPRIKTNGNWAKHLLEKLVWNRLSNRCSSTILIR